MADSPKHSKRIKLLNCHNIAQQLPHDKDF